MKRRTGRPISLARQYLRWLAALCAAVVLVTVASALFFVLLPLAQRSADDLAGLMVLSAQTWAELPPDTRPDFEAELLGRHQIVLRPGMAAPTDSDLRHGFYLHFLAGALAQRSGAPVFFRIEPMPGGGSQVWTALVAGGQSIGVGFASTRLNTRPFAALAVVLLLGLGGVVLAAWWLARAIVRPVAALEQAAAQLASGSNPALLPQSGPRELAELAGHFNQMALQVRELIEARTTLLAGVSHDLRTPLARMRLALEMLTIQPDPALLRRLESDIDEMNALIGQMLSLARGLGGEAVQDIALAPWLAQRLQLHQAAAQQAASTLVLDCPADLHGLAAPGLLGRVLDNLIVNALRYAPGAIEVSAARLDGGPPHAVRIRLMDRGPGIPEAQQAAVWRPFQRVEASRSPQTGGYGLGLAIVRRLAQSQAWPVALGNRPGGGLAVSVDIPAAPAPPAAARSSPAG